MNLFIGIIASSKVSSANNSDYWYYKNDSIDIYPNYEASDVDSTTIQTKDSFGTIAANSGVSSNVQCDITVNFTANAALVNGLNSGDYRLGTNNGFFSTNNGDVAYTIVDAGLAIIEINDTNRLFDPETPINFVIESKAASPEAISGTITINSIQVTQSV